MSDFAPVGFEFFPPLVAPAPLETPPPPPADPAREVRAVPPPPPGHRQAQHRQARTRDELTELSWLAAETRLALLAFDPEDPLRGPSPTD